MAAHFRKLDPFRDIVGKLNARQLAYWFAYFELEPTIEERLDLLLPKLAAHIMNMLRAEDSPPVEMSDVRIDWAADPPPPVDYSEQVAASETDMAANIMAAFGGG